MTGHPVPRPLRSSQPRLALWLTMAAIALVFAGLTAPLNAQQEAEPTNTFSDLPVPRFVSLRYDEAFLRQGPTLNHRVLFRYTGLEGMPLKVVGETERWRRVEDFDGDEGWIHQSQLASDRGAYVTGTGPAVLRQRPDAEAQAVARLEPGVLGRLGSCNAEWCALSAAGFDGWIRRNRLWGLLEGEMLD